MSCVSAAFAAAVEEVEGMMGNVLSRDIVRRFWKASLKREKALSAIVAAKHWGVVSEDLSLGPINSSEEWIANQLRGIRRICGHRSRSIHSLGDHRPEPQHREKSMGV
jgi:hypothetical protein